MDAMSSLTNRDLSGAEFELGHRGSYRKVSVVVFVGRLVRVVCNCGRLELWHSGSEPLPVINACALFSLLFSCCSWADFTSLDFECLKNLFQYV
jgi:hypothetical protein